MNRNLVRVLSAAALIATLGGCSQSALIDKMTSAQDKALALGVARAACDGSLAQYREQMEPSMQANLAKADAVLTPYCPNGPGKARLVGHQYNVNSVNGVSSSVQQLVVMTESKGRWTRTVIHRTSQNDGPMLIDGINVSATAEKPDDLVQLDTWDENVPYVRAGAIAVLLILIAGIVWLVRRSRAKKNEANS